MTDADDILRLKRRQQRKTVTQTRQHEATIWQNETRILYLTNEKQVSDSEVDDQEVRRRSHLRITKNNYDYQSIACNFELKP